jgi:hypothetical protein
LACCAVNDVRLERLFRYYLLYRIFKTLPLISKATLGRPQVPHLNPRILRQGTASQSAEKLQFVVIPLALSGVSEGSEARDVLFASAEEADWSGPGFSRAVTVENPVRLQPLRPLSAALTQNPEPRALSSECTEAHPHLYGIDSRIWIRHPGIGYVHKLDLSAEIMFFSQKMRSKRSARCEVDL